MSTVYRLLDVGRQFFDDNGDPYAGGKLFTYSAGSSTKKTAYQDADGSTPHTNPIVLDSAGRLPAPVWGTTGAYKFVLAPSTDTDPPSSAEWTEDDVTGINDTASSSVDQWIESSLTPTYVGATSFTLVGDQTTVFHVGRRVKTTNSGGTRYSFISASSYSDPDTTVTVVNDSGSLDAGLSAVSYGLLSQTNPSIPKIPFTAMNTGMVVQTVEATPYTSRTDISVVIPADDTPPQQSGEGVEICTVAITPTRATNRLRIEFECFGAVASAGSAVAAIFQDSTANAIAATLGGGPAGGQVNLKIAHEMVAGGTSSITFKARVGPTSSAVNFYINGNSGGRLLGGVAASRMRVTEIAA